MPFKTIASSICCLAMVGLCGIEDLTASQNAASPNAVTQRAAVSTPPPLSPISVTASTAHSDDLPHCFKQDDSRDLTFSISTSTIATGTARIELIDLSQILQQVNGSGTGQKDTPVSTTVETSEGPVLNHRATVTFRADIQSSARSGAPGASARSATTPPYSYHLDGGPAGKLAIVTVSASGASSSLGASRIAQPPATLTSFYFYRTWKNTSQECAPLPTWSPVASSKAVDTLEYRVLSKISPGGRMITQEAFDRFLQWLAPDREQSGRKYEAIRNRLITIFATRGHGLPEEMADDCINRVIHKVPEIDSSYAGEPEFYFYSVAKFIHLEWAKKPLPLALNDRDFVKSEDSAEVESHYACLDRCLGQLNESSRSLVTEYYQHDKKAKIDHRTAMAQRLGIAGNALRIRAHRVRQTLEQCVSQCIDQQVRAV